MELSQRLDLGGLLADDSDAQEQAEARGTFARIAELVEDVSGVELEPETTIDGSGISSLSRIELAVRIEEEFAVPIDEHVYAQCTTAQDLADYVEEHQ
ncbi:acyl carrier protein [Corynebacterium afermentans subsp. lipophilum]|uniref:acyl carrier protein n=1 Tax=Corynebacterium TaxID=1716 RepID=UPI00188AD8E5|nr:MULTISPECIES: acyl carrier protein [Corynebacterium]MBF4546959.1 acyl carrier protein [Corynebacterium afermentans subsp. lipophilum]WJY59318.1 acyl carrier protein [Corynebacterium afermentans subsp. lipophilum]